MKQSLMLALLLLIGPVLGLPAQAAAPVGFELWTAASLRGTIQAITPVASVDPHHVATRQLADYPSDLFMLAHRAGDGQVEWHETRADVFFVQSGSATLIVGGELIYGETVAPHEKRNRTIEGVYAGNYLRAMWSEFRHRCRIRSYSTALRSSIIS